MTYSVVMRDPESGALGVAVQSHYFNAGRVVPWARAGVGAVATQALADPLYGPRALDLLEAEWSASDALKSLLAADARRDVRQVAIVDAAGGVAAHTGSSCIAHAGHFVGDGWSVQANIMRSESVVPAMAEAARSSQGPLPRRLFSVLLAAEAAGGDLRGRQSAALVVVDDGPVPSVDLRVADHPDPLAELGRLLDLDDGYRRLGAAGDALAAGDRDAAERGYVEIAGRDLDAEVLLWAGLGLISASRVDDGLAAVGRAVDANPDLAVLLDRLRGCGIVDEQVLERCLESLKA